MEPSNNTIQFSRMYSSNAAMNDFVKDLLSSRNSSPNIPSPYSCEPTDDQLVQQTRNRDYQRKPYRVKDFFLMIDDWSPLYTKVIMFNGLCWMMAVAHTVIVFIGSKPRSRFEYMDCQGCVYTKFRNTTFLSEQRYGATSEYLGYDSGQHMNQIGRIAGAVALVVLHKFSARTIILFSGIFYTIFVALGYTHYLPIVRLSIIMSAALAQMSGISALIHCMESVPEEIRPFAYCIMEAMGVFGSLILLIMFHMFDDWFLAVALFAGTFTLIGIGYFIFSSPSVLRALAMADRTDMIQILDKYASRKDVVFDVDCLIDDVLDKRTACVYLSKKEIIADLLITWEFVRKFFCIIFVLSTGFIMTPISRTFIYRNTYMGLMESELMRTPFIVWANNLTAFLVYIVGRRLTLVFGTWLFLTSQVLGLQIDFDFYNVCRQMEQPNTNHVLFAHFTHMLMVLAGKILRSLGMMMLIEHVPVNCHSILVPFGMIFTELLKVGWSLLTTVLENHTLNDIHENFPLVISGVIGIFAMAFVLLGIDNSSLMPVTTADIPCYFRPHEKHKQPTVLDDEKLANE